MAMPRRLALLYTSALLALFVAPLDNYLGAIGVLPVRPTILFVLGFAPIWILAAIRWMRTGLRVGDPGDLAGSNSQLVLALGFTVVVALVWNLHPEIRATGLEPRFERLYGFVNLLGALGLAWAGLREREVEIVLAPALLVLLATMYADFAEPGAFSVDHYRAAGVAGNSNLAGFVVALVAAASLDYDRARLRDVLRIAVCGAAVVWSFSRAAIVVFAVVTAVWLVRASRAALRSSGGKWVPTAALVATVTLTIVAAQGIYSGDAYRWISHRRLSTLIGDEGPETLLRSADRLRCAQYTLDALPGAWVLGRGTGFTRTLEMGPHNLFLEQWVSNGLLGLAGLCWLLGVGFWAAIARGSVTAFMTVVVIALQCLASHNLLDERPPLLVLGLVMGTTVRAARRTRVVPARTLAPAVLYSAPAAASQSR